MSCVYLQISIAVLGACLLANVSECAGSDAQGVDVLSPREYQVFQRQSRYDGQVLVSGSVRPKCDKVEVRITGKSLKGELRGKWQRVPMAASTRAFNARIPVVPGGWYRVELRALDGSKVVAQAAVDRVGVGEVFVGAGQLLCGVLIGAIASSAGGGALGYREAFGTIAALVAVMVLASVGLANRRATAS